MKTKNLIIGGSVLLAAGAGTALAILKSRASIPKGAQAVKPFDVNKYLGNWYEIARLDFHFEKDITNATAEYSLNEDNTIKVVNRGYDLKQEKWDESTGKAKFAESPDEAKLKVSFFGPIWSGYNVLAIDPQYKYALVAGRNLNYMWLLSREKTMPEKIRKEYLKKAYELGYDISKLVWTKHPKKESYGKKND